MTLPHLETLFRQLTGQSELNERPGTEGCTPTFRLCANGHSDNPIRLLLIDFDGTLADTKRANYLAYHDALAEENRSISEADYSDNYFGMRCLEFMEALGFDPEGQERMRQRKIAYYPRHFDTVCLNRPLWDVAQALRSAGGKVWIVSTGSRVNIENVMRHLGIEGEVDGVLTGTDVVCCKPAPDCFLQAMAAEGATASETLVFEDSEIGLEAAKRSGAPYVAVKF